MRIRTSTAQTSALCYDYFRNYYGFFVSVFLNYKYIVTNKYE
nr:MAG TPA_asm: hypothetical protein [Caudoviricetes sp.]